MSNPTTPFSWQMPQNTDLVTDLPADFEVFGQAVATSMADLLGGTTGQVLAKASNTDMDFVWSADAAGMTNPMTTTGDSIYSSSGSTPARLGIGSAGQVLTVTSGLPSWTTISSGGMTLISTTSLTGASVALTSIPQSYVNLQLIVLNYKAATSSEILQLRFNQDSTANNHALSSGAFALSYNQTSSQITKGENPATSQSSVVVTIYNYTNATIRKRAEAITLSEAAGDEGFVFTMAYKPTTAISSFSLFPENGNFSSGTVLLYGVK